MKPVLDEALDFSLQTGRVGGPGGSGVARLMAEGCTNPQIGEALFISRRTGPVADCCPEYTEKRGLLTV